MTHSMLAMHRSEVLHPQPDSERTNLLNWCDTLTGHLFRLYLITGSTDFLAILSVVECLQSEAETLSAHDQTRSDALRELAEQLNRTVIALVEGNTSASAFDGEAALVGGSKENFS